MRLKAIPATEFFRFDESRIEEFEQETAFMIRKDDSSDEIETVYTIPALDNRRIMHNDVMYWDNQLQAARILNPKQFARNWHVTSQG